MREIFEREKGGLRVFLWREKREWKTFWKKIVGEDFFLGQRKGGNSFLTRKSYLNFPK